MTIRLTQIAAAVLLLVFPPPLLHAIVLPYTCTSTTTTASVHGYIEIDNSPNPIVDFDEDDDSETGGATTYTRSGSANVDVSVSTADGNGSGTVNAVYYIMTANPVTYYATLSATADTQFSTYNTGRPVNFTEEASAYVSGTYVLQANPINPAKGQAANSATITQKLQFLAGNEVYGSDNSFTTTMEVVNGNSHLTLTQLDAAGTQWLAEGELSDYGNDPIEVSDTYDPLENIYYEGYQLSQVGGTFTVSCSVEHEGTFNDEAYSGYDFFWGCYAWHATLAP